MTNSHGSSAPRWRAQPQQSATFLYIWLLVVIVFEYARPAAFVPALRALPLNSMLPLVLLVVCFFASGLRPLKTIFSDPMAKWLCVYLGLVWLGVVHADNMLRAYTAFKTCLGYGFLAFMIARIVTTRARLYGVFGTLIAAHLFLVAMNPAVILNPDQRDYVRGATFLGDGNDFGLSVAMLVPLSIIIALTRSSKMMKIFWFLITLLLVLAIVGTSSRGATLGVAGVVVFLVSQSKRKMLAVTGVMVLMLGVLVYAPDAYFERMGTVATYQQDTSATGRIEAWKAGARMALSNPLLGVGSGNFPNSFPKYRGPNAPVRWMTAHSMYFLVLGEMGLPGLLTLVTLVVGNMLRTFKASVRAREAVAKAGVADNGPMLLLYMAAVFVGFAISGAFLSVAYYPHIFVMTALALAARDMVARSMEAVAGAPQKPPEPKSKRLRARKFGHYPATRESLP